jgi:hypothetical protein
MPNNFSPAAVLFFTSAMMNSKKTVFDPRLIAARKTPALRKRNSASHCSLTKDKTTTNHRFPDLDEVPSGTAASCAPPTAGVSEIDPQVLPY